MAPSRSSAELTQVVDLIDDRGQVAAGWSRRPLHRCRLDGPWGRRKRWHYWCVTSPREIVSLTFGDLDYAGAIAIVVVDRTTGRAVRDTAVRPGGWHLALPDVADRGRVEVSHRGVHLSLVDHGDHARLVARSPRLGVDVTAVRPEGHETLNVAVDWGARRFAYTAKHNTLPAAGTLELDGARRAIAPGAFATLDWGRGVWPARTRWNWASASGVVGGRTIGVNLGAQWTDEENAICVDGRLRKLATRVWFEWDRGDPERPWRLIGDGVDLTVTPEHVETLGPVLRVAFGRFDGRVGDVEIEDLFGWAEELEVIW